MPPHSDSAPSHEQAPGNGRAKVSVYLKIAFAAALLVSVTAEGLVSWILMRHAPRLGWAFTLISVAALFAAVGFRWRKARRRALASSWVTDAT